MAYNTPKLQDKRDSDLLGKQSGWHLSILCYFLTDEETCSLLSEATTATEAGITAAWLAIFCEKKKKRQVTWWRSRHASFRECSTWSRETTPGSCVDRQNWQRLFAYMRENSIFTLVFVWKFFSVVATQSVLIAHFSLTPFCVSHRGGFELNWNQRIKDKKTNLKVCNFKKN